VIPKVLTIHKPLKMAKSSVKRISNELAINLEKPEMKKPLLFLRRPPNPVRGGLPRQLLSTSRI